MAKIAVIKTGGKQYKVEEGKTLKIEKLGLDKGAKINLETLLLASEKGDVQIGMPSLGEKVEAEIMEHGKGDKVNVTKYKNKTRYLRNVGHRQAYTKIKINKIA